MAPERGAGAAVAFESPYTIEALLVVASSAHGPEGHFDLPSTGAPSGPDHDHFADAAAARAWLGVRREFVVPTGAPDESELAVLRGIREAVHLLARNRRVAYEHRASRLLRDAAYRLTPDRRLGAVADGWLGFATGLLVPLAQLDVLRARLGFCANPRCRWLFLDESDSHTRRWCDATACGNRAKVRRHRARERLAR